MGTSWMCSRGNNFIINLEFKENKMSIEKMISDLKKYGNLFEVSQKTIFEGYRKDKNGNEQKIEVSIFDAGSDVNPQIRYYCEATSEDGKKMATGNPDSSIELALMQVHWNNLD